MIRQLLPVGVTLAVWVIASLDFAQEGAYAFHNPLPWRTATSWAEDLMAMGTCPKPSDELPIVPPKYLADKLKQATTLEDWQRWFGEPYCTRVVSGSKKALIWEVPFWNGHYLMLTFRQEDQEVSRYDIIRTRN